MNKFKSVWIREKCLRCGGNLMLEREDYGHLIIKCLMCSRVIHPDDITPPAHSSKLIAHSLPLEAEDYL